MQNQDHCQPCPFCGGSEVQVTGEREKRGRHEIRLECMPCGELWWEPAADSTKATDSAKTTSSIDEFSASLIRNVRELSYEPDRLFELSKRGF